MVCEMRFTSNDVFCGNPYPVCKTIRICHGVRQIEKSVPRVTVWHHEACRMMSDCDPKGRIFLSVPHIHDRFFFLPAFQF